MNRDQIEGKAKVVKGHIKEAAGAMLDDPNLQDEGTADRAEGELQDGYGKAKEKVGEVVQNIGKAIKK